MPSIATKGEFWIFSLSPSGRYLFFEPANGLILKGLSCIEDLHTGARACRDDLHGFAVVNDSGELLTPGESDDSCHDDMCSKLYYWKPGMAQRLVVDRYGDDPHWIDDQTAAELVKWFGGGAAKTPVTPKKP